LRGTGDSSIPFSYNFTASAAADDLKAVLDFLNINQTYVFAHDKGTGVAAALAAKIRGRIKRLGLSEYPLPGLGYETFQAPTPTWNLYSNWQLAFFSVPDAAQFFIQGRERQMLSWYFYHAGYSGTSAFSDDLLTLYTDSIAKPGYLRSGLEYFSNPTVAQDAAFFSSTLVPQPFSGPTLVLGGEASLSNTSLIRQLFSPVASNLTADIVPKAGHWIGEHLAVPET
jgi:pimeloyl-ACP methyl ester carboxylesterase